MEENSDNFHSEGSANVAKGLEDAKKVVTSGEEAENSSQNDLQSPKNTSDAEYNLSDSNDKYETKDDKSGSSDEEDLSIFKYKPKKSRLRSVSSSDNESHKDNINSKSPSPNLNNLSDSNDGMTLNKSKKSRLRAMSSSDEETVNKSDESDNVTKPVQSVRVKEKDSKFKSKFKGLISSRSLGNDKLSQKSDNSNKSTSESDKSVSGDDMSIEKIKKKIKERNKILKSTIYDPDTSDDEKAHHKELNKGKKKKKSAKEDGPKPVRMSAKIAMENMHKIKSESNRMLREKEVSLPYHRPKALSLKDIMSRHKPALGLDGKALPLKMNNEQLRQYSLLLEERQKEMLELCKSDSEEEPDDVTNQPELPEDKPDTENTDSPSNNALTEPVNHLDDDVNLNHLTSTQDKENKQDISCANDDLFDSQINENATEGESTEKTQIIINNTEIESISMEKDSHEKSPIEENTEVQSNEKEILAETPIENNLDKEVPVKEDAAEVQGATEDESQVMNLHYDTEKTDTNTENVSEQNMDEDTNTEVKKSEFNEIDGFSDDEDMDIQDIDKLIESADVIENSNIYSDSPMLIRDLPKKANPTLTGAPGMIIDLDGNDLMAPKKLSGIELLKERFTYFSKLKTPEELERQTKNKLKPGTLHLKLKQELEEKLAEQRSLEWTKRLEEERQNKLEMSALRGDDSDEEDELEKIESKLEENGELEKEEDGDSSETESEVEDDVLIEDKPLKKNALLDDEAEESGDDNENGDVQDDDGNDASDESDESSDSDDELQVDKPKKNRILKAFEDSDDEAGEKNDESVVDAELKTMEASIATQDKKSPSAVFEKSISEDLFSSQASSTKTTNISANEVSTAHASEIQKIIENGNQEKTQELSETQLYDESKFDDIAGMCTGGFTQNITTQTVTDTPTQNSADLGDDILALCTGNFVDNKFVTQNDQEDKENQENGTNNLENQTSSTEKQELLTKNIPKVSEDTTLKSILDELNDPEFDSPSANKFFAGNQETPVNVRRKFILDSDDEDGSKVESSKKKRKKRREDRALQISDDEDELEQEPEEEYESALEDVDEEREIQYDSEENEIEVIPQMPTKRVKRKTAEFFEQEAELTSEDEWAGSGDEDEAGLDRMEREEGDDDTFHQGKLQRELEKIHMRDVMDQDQREVRLLQELLLEDDLGGGHRQRKFRWRNADGEEEEGAMPEFGDSQEEEQESEEQWRKQRHEREVFLRQLKEKQSDVEEPNFSLNRSGSITAVTKNTLDVTAKPDSPVVMEKKNKDIPSPVKKPFALLQQNYHGSLLSRGTSALSRLAALATPLAGGGGDDAPKTTLGPSNKRNFVFAAVSPAAEDKPKVSKRKAENIGTPNLMKKLKTEEKRDNMPRSSLLDHMKA